MKRFQVFAIAVGVVILAIVFMQPVKATIQTQQAQIAITVVVPVQGTPIAYVPHQGPAQAGQPTISSISLRRAAPALQREFRAEGLHFTSNGDVVAQAQVQNSLLVQAEVTPNPKGTILVTNNSGVTFPPVAPGGTATISSCSLTVTVNMATAWTLDEGVSNDFASGFSGGDLANNTYKNSATAQPTSTPYIVYADDGKSWSVLNSGSAITTFCVNLTVKVPLTVTDGTYSTNAVYTLFN